MVQPEEKSCLNIKIKTPVFNKTVTNNGFGHQILSNEYILLCQDGISQVINDSGSGIRIVTRNRRP
jgi:hypothetical protein